MDTIDKLINEALKVEAQDPYQDIVDSIGEMITDVGGDWPEMFADDIAQWKPIVQESPRGFLHALRSSVESDTGWSITDVRTILELFGIKGRVSIQIDEQ